MLKHLVDLICGDYEHNLHFGQNYGERVGDRIHSFNVDSERIMLGDAAITGLFSLGKLFTQKHITKKYQDAEKFKKDFESGTLLWPVANQQYSNETT